MKRKIITTIVASIFLGIILVGCGKGEPVATNNTIAETEVVEEKASTETIEAEVETEAENEEALHEHNFVEVGTKEATCTETGEKTLTCECGETKTEVIEATGHEFTEYVSNEDATYEADGTETAKCNNCEETDTRVVEGSMLTYSFEDMNVTKYVKSTVNVRSIPNSDGDKLGGLELNDEVKVTGKCVETGWYRIEYNGSIAYVSDSYLVDNKVEAAKAPASTNNNSSSTSSVSSSSECPYPLYTVYEDSTTYWFYCVWDKVNHPGNFGSYWSCAKSIEGPWNVAHGYNEQASGMMRSDPLDTPYMSDGLYVLKVVYQK